MKVFLHTRGAPRESWRNEVHEFTRVPLVGECLTLGQYSSVYKVQFVLNTPLGFDYEVEIFAEEIELVEAMRQALSDIQ